MCLKSLEFSHSVAAYKCENYTYKYTRYTTDARESKYFYQYICIFMDKR